MVGRVHPDAAAAPPQLSRLHLLRYFGPFVQSVGRSVVRSFVRSVVRLAVLVAVLLVDTLVVRRLLLNSAPCRSVDPFRGRFRAAIREFFIHRLASHT